jgi:hypothetical protein
MNACDFIAKPVKFFYDPRWRERHEHIVNFAIVATIKTVPGKRE